VRSVGGAAIAAWTHAIREVAGNPGIRRIETAWSLGIAADWAYLVVLLITAYAAGGALGVGVLGVVRMIPPMLVGPFADVPVARLRGDRALVAVNLVRAGAAAVTAIVLVLGASPWLTFVLAGILAGAGALVRPIQNALMPALARSPSELIAANVTSSLGEGAGAFVGPLAGGAIAVGVSPTAGCVVVTVTFLAAAAVLVGLRFADEADARGGALTRVSGVAIPRAVRALRSRPGVALIVLDFGGQVFVRGMLTTLIVVASIELLGLGDSGVGLLNAAVGLGGLIGAIGAVGLTRIPRLAAAFAVALAFWGLPIAVIGAWPLVPLAVAGLLVTGISNALLDISGFTIMQRGIPSSERVPVFGLFEGMIGIGVATGGIVASILVELFGTRGALGIAGAILPLLAVATWGRVSRLDRESAVPLEQAVVFHGIPLFAPLPLTAIDRLAAAARPVTFGPGDVLMRQGEPGDTYIAIESGTVAIEVDGRAVATCGVGEGIGEIALLRRVPRTATATASTAVTGFALAGADFLAAIAGPATASMADSLVEERLAR
jgi:cyclic nucleotide-binding protein/MFS transporter